MLTSHRTIKWIESLAEQEMRIRAGERVSIDIGAAREEVLSVETVSFVRELFYHFEDMVQLFNRRVGDPGLQIKLMRDGEGVDGFSLNRNGMRLLLTRTQAGVIQLMGDKYRSAEGITAPRTSVMFSGTIEATFGTFDDVEWHFLGSPVTAEQVARHYLTEFIQMSRGPAYH